MEIAQSREQLFERINRGVMIVYIGYALVVGIINIVKGQPYYYLLSFGSILLFPAVWGAYRLIKINRCHQLEFIIYLYTFLAFPLGSVADFYHAVPYYDKLMHTLSGVLTVALALPLYYKLSPDSVVRPEDKNQAITFCLLAAIAVAGLWEIGEYLLNFITNMDHQRVLTTGIDDSMQDMIVATFGALCTLPSIASYYRKKRITFVMSAFHAFSAANLKGNAVWDK